MYYNEYNKYISFYKKEWYIDCILIYFKFS